MEELFRRAREILHGAGDSDDASPGEQARVARRRVLDVLRKQMGEPAQEGAEGAAAPADMDGALEAAERLVDAMDERLLSSLSPRQLARLVRLAREHERTGVPAELAVSCYPLKGHSEVAVVARDVPGLLAAIAGALAANRIDVLGAVIGSLELPGARPVALDVFFVRDLYDRAIPAEDGRWERLRADLAGVLAGGQEADEAAAALLARRRKPSGLGPRVTPGVPTEVKIHNDASADATVIEVFTRDRVGVLHAITRTLADLGLDIHVSKVSTEGEQVADVFYVTHGDERLKLTNPDLLRMVSQRLYDVLDDM